MNWKVINFKLTFHKLLFMHEWEEIGHIYADPFGYITTPSSWDMSSIIHTLRCKTCGTLKRKKIKL